MQRMSPPCKHPANGPMPTQKIKDDNVQQRFNRAQGDEDSPGQVYNQMDSRLRPGQFLAARKLKGNAIIKAPKVVARKSLEDRDNHLLDDRFNTFKRDQSSQNPLIKLFQSLKPGLKRSRRLIRSDSSNRTKARIPGSRRRRS